MEVVNFRVGDRLVAFNILDILLTEKFSNDQTSVPTDDQALLGVKDFMGVPTPIYDLGLAMNKTSTQAKNQDLLNHLYDSEQDHELWLDTLENCIKNDKEFTLSRDSNKCQFGKWLGNFATNNQDLADVIKRFATPHQQLHNLADQVIQLNQQNKKEAAITLIHQQRNGALASLKRLFSTARDQLEAAYKPVTVYTTIDGRKPVLGFVVDKVEDSIHVDDKQIRPLKEMAQYIGNIDHRVKNMIEGLLTTESNNSLLLSCKSFL